MSNFVRFTPFSGAFNNDPLSYGLEIDQSFIMLDCGWTATFDHTDSIDLMKKNASRVDILLLSHGDMQHIGALVHLVKWGLNCPIYATLPVAQMGKITLLDCIASRRLEQDFEDITVEDVEVAFDRITQLKYSQSVALSGNCQGMVIAPYAAGHTIGGTIWRLKKDTDEILYAVSYNHKRERHLNGTPLQQFTRPSLLITDTYNIQSVQSTRKERDSMLLQKVSQCLALEGSVLMPCDSATRVLELVHLMDQLWSHRQLSYPLVLVSTYAPALIDYAKSMLEWMGDSAVKQFATTRETPFDFKFLKVCRSLKDLERFGSGPRVVLASLSSLEYGFARSLFLQFANDRRSMILFSDRSARDTLQTKLLQSAGLVEDEPSPESKIKQEKGGTKLKLSHRKRVPLEGKELKKYRREQKEKQEREKRDILMMERKKKILEAGDDEDDDDPMMLGDGLADQEMVFYGDNYDYFVADSVEMTNAGDAQVAMDVDVTEDASVYLRRELEHREGASSRSVLFPFREYRVRVDEYGEVIDQEEYIDKQIQAAQQATEALSGILDMNAMAPQSLKLPFDDEDTPTRCISEDIEVSVECKIDYIDFEGLSDGKSIKTILKHVQPKKSILIHGTPESTREAYEYFQATEELKGGEVYIPKVGEWVNVSTATNIYQVKLSDALLSTIEFQQIHDYEIAFINGKLQLQGKGEGEPKEEEKMDGDVMEEQEEKEDGGENANSGNNNNNNNRGGMVTMDVIPPSEKWKPTTREMVAENMQQKIIVGDAKLTELKKEFERQLGIQSDFDRGSLVIGSGREWRVQKVAAPKEQPQQENSIKSRLILEGPFSRDYYRLRKLIYSKHAIL